MGYKRLDKQDMEWVLRRCTPEPNTGCLLWCGSSDKRGYGRIRRRSNHAYEGVHRFVYELHFGPIQKGLFVLHKCDVPACVLIDHLFLGTQKDNMADMHKKGRWTKGATTHCRNGHPFYGENLIKTKRQRVCRACTEASRERVRASKNTGIDNKDKTHCKRDHEFTNENTKINATSGSRQCRECLRIFTNKRTERLRKERLDKIFGRGL